jgi:hypothetical protein
VKVQTEKEKVWEQFRIQKMITESHMEAKEKVLRNGGRGMPEKWKGYKGEVK